MALFKQMRGNRASLDAQPLHDGYAYFCVDDGTFHIDYKDADGKLQRKQISAKDAETLCGLTLEELQSQFSTQDTVVLSEAQSYTDAALETATTQDAVVLHEAQAYTDDAINEVNGKTVDKIANIDTWWWGRDSIDYNDTEGISWRDGFAFITAEDETVSEGSITQQIPIVAGENITFEVDPDCYLIRISATGGGASTNESMIGTWVFNDELTFPSVEGDESLSYQLAFVGTDANGSSRSFDTLIFRPSALSVSYYDGASQTGIDGVYDDGWMEEFYKTIEILDEPSAEVSALIKSTAAKQSTVDDNSTYISKYIVELTGSEQVTDIISKLQETYPDYQLGEWSLIQFSGATSALYGLTIQHYGGNMYNISGMDFGTYYTTANNVRDWSQVSMWSFSSYFQPPVPYCDETNDGQFLVAKYDGDSGTTNPTWCSVPNAEEATF